MDCPSLVDILSVFATVPPVFKVDFALLRATWEWALEIGTDVPEATFSMDELPTLCFMAVLSKGNEEEGPVYQTASGIVLQC